MEDECRITEEGNRCLRLCPCSGGEKDYRYFMLTENKIPGLLPMEERMVDGESLAAFEITAKTSLFSLCNQESLRSPRLADLILHMGECVRCLQDHLIETECLRLGPSDIYLDPESGRFLFTCMPQPEGEWRRRLLSLLRFLMEKIDYREETGVCLIYELYHVCSTDHVTFSQLEDCVRKITGGKEEKSPEEGSLEDQVLEEPEEEKKTESFPGERKTEKSGRFLRLLKSAAGYILPAAAAVLLWYFWFGR